MYCVFCRFVVVPVRVIIPVADRDRVRGVYKIAVLTKSFVHVHLVDILGDDERTELGPENGQDTAAVGQATRM